MLIEIRDPLRKKIVDKVDLAIYDVLFAICGGLSADPNAGWWAADKYAKWRLSRMVEVIDLAGTIKNGWYKAQERCCQHISLANIGEEDTTDVSTSDLSERISQWKSKGR